jgi:hypothetical protein
MTRITAVYLIVFALWACGSKPETTPAAEQPAAPAAPAPAAAPEVAEKAAEPGTGSDAPPSDRVEDPTFELAVAPAGPYAAGKLGSFAVSLKPRGEYHINQDFPMSVSVQDNAGDPPGSLEFPKSKLDKPEAAEFGEQLARFDVPFTPKSAGAHKVVVDVKFAVCTPENCVPDERTLAVMLPVE